MNLASRIKSLTRPTRLRLSRLLSRHDAQEAGERGRRADESRAEAARLAGELGDARGQAESARAARGRPRALADAHARLGASDEARRAAEAELDGYRSMTWDRALDLVGEVNPDKDWQAAAWAVNRAVERLLRPFHKSATWGDRLLTLDKTAAITRDPRFQAAFATFRGKHPYDQYDGPDSITWRLNTLVWAGRVAAGLDGDFVECGVFKGDMAYTVAACLGFETLPKTFHLYDSFEGYSPRYSSPADFPFNPNFYDQANKAYQVPGMYEAVRDRFAAFPNVVVVRGFVPDALDPAAHQRIAFLHIDLNSPAAEVACLEHLFDRVVPGGVVLLDDYGWVDFAPQKTAEDEFFGRRGYQVLELPTGQGLVVKR